MGVTKSFADKVAALIPGADATAVFQALNTWEPFENANAAFNPTATTQPAAGAQPLGGNPNQNNGNPVKEYPNEDVGAKATAETLMNGRYPDLLNWVKTGTVSDPTRIASQLRTWGTTGLAAQFEGGHVPTSTGGTVPAPPATTTAAGGSKADQAVALWQQFMAQKPDPEDAVAFDAWVKTMTQLGDIAKSLQTAEGKRDTGFDQQLSAFNAQVTATHYQNADALASAGADVNRSLNGMQVGTERAKTALDAAKLLAQWGTPAGKSSYSANDLGEAYANTFRQAGLDPSKGMLNYTGTQHIDPTNLANEYDTQLGVGGPLTTIPNFINVPDGAGLPAATQNDGGGVPSWGLGAQGSVPASSTTPDPFSPKLSDMITPPASTTSNGIFDPYATLKQLFPGITFGESAPSTGAVSNRTIDVTKPASAYGGNNATRFLWGDNPATAQQPTNLLGGTQIKAPQFNWFG